LLGGAFLAKYTAVLLVPAVLLYLAFSAPSRRWLRRPSFYAGGLVALVMAMPVIVWNASRGWPSLQLHLVERASVGVPVAGENTVNHLVAISSSDGAGLLQSIVRVLVGQAMAYSPLLVPLLAIGIWRTLRRTRSDDRYLFLAAFTWPVLAPLLVAMTRFHDAEQHWTMMAMVPAVVAAARYGDERWSRARGLRALALAGVGLSGMVFVLANVHARTTAILRLLPADHYDAKADMVNELVGWDQVRASLVAASSAVHGNVVLASNHYSMCGRMLYEMGDSPSVYCPTERRSAYDFFGRHDVPADATAIVLTTDIHSDLPEGLEGRTCTRVDTVDVERGGRPVAHYFVQSCPPAAVELQERASRD
ncbi:MAG: glycosyltransferase family 39 protein, partial [Polyangiaceae bacterium]